jgi:glycerol-3-phosphate dehydrogenase (NAD(P)+)
MARQYGVEMPISEQVYGILHAGRDPEQCLRELLAREPKPERI